MSKILVANLLFLAIATGPAENDDSLKVNREIIGPVDSTSGNLKETPDLKSYPNPF